ncbi:MAG: hypothetical protein RL685_3181 [Pseudomonadota bacterium]|jgi:hypothetical protein
MKIAASTRSFIQRTATVLSCVCALGALSGCGDEEDDEESTTAGNQPGSNLSFFVTSTTHDGNLGGLAGADQICDDLATAAGAGSKTWRAYLSVANNGAPLHARDRIGTGPWMNAAGVMIAANLDALHALTGDENTFITEKNEKVNGQWNGANGMNGAPVNEHDIVTGSGPDGRFITTLDATTMMPQQTTCNDWTSNTLTPGPQVGHTDGMGPMMATDMPRFTSWNGGHPARGCSTADLAPSGSTGRFYCFATN